MSILDTVSHLNESAPVDTSDMLQCDVGDHMVDADEVQLITGTYTGDTWMCDDCSDDMYAEAQHRRYNVDGHEG